MDSESEGSGDGTSAGLSEANTACITENADEETANKVLEAIDRINSGADVEPDHVLDLIESASVVAGCGIIPENVAVMVEQIERDDAACVINETGVEPLLGMFILPEEGQSTTFNLMSLAPLLGALQICDVELDLSMGR